MQKQHSQRWRSSWNCSCSGLTSIILTVLSRVSLQVQGQFFLNFLEVSFQNCDSAMPNPNFFHLEGCLWQLIWNSSQDMVQNVIHSPCGGTKGPWLCLMTKLLSFGLDCFPLLLHFLTSLIKLFPWLKFFFKEQVEDMVRKNHWIVLRFSHTP